MRTTGQTERGPAAARLLGLLAVLLGLLAMHGLASSHHAAAAVLGHAAAAPATATATAERSGAAAEAHHAGAGAAVMAHPNSADQMTPTAEGLAVRGPGGPANPACDDDCQDGLAAVCAAVLAAVAAAAALRRAATRRPVLPARPRGGPRPRAPARAQPLFRGPDPVAALCVSRT